MADNKLGETDYVDARSFMGYTNKTNVMIHDKRVPDMRAKFAMVLMERWGMVTAAPDGDDTVGRQKFRRLDPYEVAQYACEVSRHAFDRFEQLGWIADIGDFDAASERASDTN